LIVAFHQRRIDCVRIRIQEDSKMNSVLRVAIADDERPARSFLAAMLRSFDDVKLIGEASNGAEAIELIGRERPDLALLDLQMPEIDGLGVVRLLKKSRMPLIAFVTAYDEYAVRAFELNAVDYLLKPVDRARLREALNRAQERLEQADLRMEAVARVDAAAYRVHERTELIALDAAVRETAEESGVTVEVTGLAGIYTDPGHVIADPRAGLVRQPFAVCFHACPLSGSPGGDQVETSDARWLTIGDIPALPIRPAMRLRIDHALTPGRPCHIG